MRLLRILGLAAAFTLALAGSAQADPVTIGTAILTALSVSASTAGTVIALGVTIAGVVGEVAILGVVIGLSYLAQAIQGGPKSSSAGVGSSGKIQTGGILPRSFMAGYGMTAGKLAYVNTWGKDGKTPNAYLSMVVSLEDLPCDSLHGIIVNDSPATYGSGDPDSDLGYAIPEFNSGGKDHLWVKFYDGTQTSADAHLVSTFSTDPSFPYSDQRIGTGVAYAIVTALVEPTLFSGFPTFKFILNGAKFYDPRLDDTAGGAGAQRFADPTTWAFTQNPKVIEYNILRGITYGGAWFYGLQNFPATRLPTSSWFAAMNECDLEVDNSDASTEPQYRCGGEITVDVQPADAIDELDKCCNGRLAEIGGVYKTHVGAAGSAVFSFTDDDLLSTEQQTFDQFPGLDTLINAITGSFPDPTQGWELSPAPGRYDPSLEADDGDRELVSDVQYTMVPYPEQVQRLMASALNEARQFRRHTVAMPPSFWPVETLDYGAWTSNRNGYSNKVFRVDAGTDQGNLDIVLMLTETDPSDYDWSPDDDFIGVTTGTLVIQRPTSQPFSGWEVDGETIDGDDGRQEAAIRFTWGTTDITDVNGVLYEVRLAATAVTVLAGETDHFSDGTITVSQNILSGTNYEARGQYRPTNGNRATDWSDWLPATTPDIRIGAIELYDQAVSRAKLSQTLQDFQDFLGDGLRSALDQILGLSQGITEANAAAMTSVQSVRNSLVSVTGSVRADFEEAITAATGPDSAIVTDIDTLTATLGSGVSPSATVTAALAAQASDITSQAAEITTLSATFGGTLSPTSTVSSALSAQATAITANADSILDLGSAVNLYAANGRFRVTTVASMFGADATLALSVSVDGHGDPVTAGMYMNAVTGSPSTVLFEAGLFIITDGTHTGTPFLFDGSTLFVDSAVIPNLDAGKITSGELDVGILIADSGILGPKVALGEIARPYLAVQSGTATTGSTLGDWVEMCRTTVTALGGIITIDGNFTASKAGSGSYGDGFWQIISVAVGDLASLGTIVDSNGFYANDAGELSRSCLAEIASGVYAYGDTFDVVMVGVNAGASKPLIFARGRLRAIAVR